MTYEFKILLSLLRYPVFGTDTEIDGTYDQDMVCRIALKQGVFPMAYASMTRHGEQFDKQWENMFLASVMQNERKLNFLAAIVDEFEKNGIECCVLKGCTIAALYHMPECRVSGDIDILIPPEREKEAIVILEGLGMKVTERCDGSQHFVAHSSIAGVVEVHVFLYSQTFNDIVLRNKFDIKEKYITIAATDYLTVNKLGVTDDLYFLTAHLIKHFIKEGCGIRQVTDLLVYIDKNRDSIDFGEYFEGLRELGFEKLIKNILGIGVEFFDMVFDEYETDYIETILTDIEDGGNFGFGEEERKGFYEKFLSLRTSLSDSDFKNMMDKKQKKSILKVVFAPSRRYLINKGYSYLDKTVLLYPVAYLHRLLDVTIMLLKGERNLQKDFYFNINDNEKLKDRALLMEKLELI